MPNKNYRNGRAREYKAMNLLREAGYECIRAAGSKGHWDIVAWKHTDFEPIRFIQVKSNCLPSAAEVRSMQLALVPPVATKEVWLFRSNKPLEIVRI